MNIERIVPIANTRSTRVEPSWFAGTAETLARTTPVADIIEIGGSSAFQGAINAEVDEAFRREGETVFLLYGGDGTLNRTWQQITDHLSAEPNPGKIILAHVIGGAVNVNARILGIPPTETAVVSAVRQAQALAVDQQHATLTLATGERVRQVGLLEFGFIGAPPFIREYEEVRGRFRSVLNRIRVAIGRSFHKIRPQEVTVEQGGSVVYERPTLLLETINGPFILGRQLSPRTLTDGLMTAFLVPASVPGEALARVAVGYTALSLGVPEPSAITQIHAPELVFRFPQSAEWHRDGEPGDLPVTAARVTVVPQSVPFLLPARER